MSETSHGPEMICNVSFLLRFLFCSVAELFDGCKGHQVLTFRLKEIIHDTGISFPEASAVRRAVCLRLIGNINGIYRAWIADGQFEFRYFDWTAVIQKNILFVTIPSETRISKMKRIMIYINYIIFNVRIIARMHIQSHANCYAPYRKHRRINFMINELPWIATLLGINIFPLILKVVTYRADYLLFIFCNVYHRLQLFFVRANKLSINVLLKTFL